MKTYDVVALGEPVIDFTENGISKQGNPLLEANPGGAPGNVLAMLNRLGKKTAFIGKVGNDIWGDFLKKTLDKAGINTQNLCIDSEINTTLAFIKTIEEGDRCFSFYRNPGADIMLRKEEINSELLADTHIFHFGSLSMTHEIVREATIFGIETAKKKGALISFDPNLREPLWKSMEDAREQISYGMSKCDILKISDNEIQWYTGEMDFDKGVAAIRSMYKIPLILVSMGKAGSRAYYFGKSESIKVECAPFLQSSTIETTGAGDTFGACVLNYVLEHGIEALSKEQLLEMLTFANAAASIITTRKGALAVMPEKEEILQLLKQRKR